MQCNITLYVAHSSSCGPDDGHQLTETCCPIEFIQDPCNRDLAFVVFHPILKQADYLTQRYGKQQNYIFFTNDRTLQVMCTCVDCYFPAIVHGGLLLSGKISGIFLYV